MIFIVLRLKIYKKNFFQILILVVKISQRPLLYFEKNKNLTKKGEILDSLLRKEFFSECIMELICVYIIKIWGGNLTF